MSALDLDAYQEKRDFAKTPEPAGTDAGREGPLTFVVQKHDATRLHYDVRFEIDGVLYSFPVPKGPSPDTTVRRQVVQTEHHPLDYARFEGVIPKGQYGAGQVIVWDSGTYSPDEGGALWFHDRDEANRLMREQVANGKLSVTFRGRKLKGSYAFVRTNEKERQWLVLKHKDAAANPGYELTEDGSSVISGLTIEDLKDGRLPSRDIDYPPVSPADATGAVARAIPPAFVPMMAAAEKQPFSADAWLYEPKLDGIRGLAFVDGGTVNLYSRTKRSLTDGYPRVVRALGDQPVASAIFDGEIVAFDERGRPSFELLQQRMNLVNAHDIRAAEAEVPAIFLAFDLLYLDGFDLRKTPLWQRQELLARTVLAVDGMGIVSPIDADGEDAYAAAVAVGFEGIVAKRRTSAYEAGKRSPSWVKVKARHTEEFVVGGYTPGEGSRGSTFGAILVGRPLEDGRLRYAGRAGSGFTDKLLDATFERLQSLRVDESPFDAAVPESKGAVYVRPELVAELEFVEITSAGTLRAPVFKGFREDKTIEDLQVTAPDAPPAPAVDSSVDYVLAQLDQPAAEFDLSVEGHTLRLTNLDKELWPAHGEQRALTKRDLLRHFARVSPYVLPHLRDRTITLTRYPNGITADYFYQKHSEDGVPPYVETVQVFTESGGGIDRPFILCNNLASLLWLGQLADLELHVSFGRVTNQPDAAGRPEIFSGSKAVVEESVLNYPDFILFDLDPYIYAGHEVAGEEPQLNRKAFDKACSVALWLKEILDSASLSSYIKTSGATGLHIYVPILRQFDYGVVRAVSETISQEVFARHPQDVTLEWSTQKRRGKIFMDVNQNARNKNLASIYSPRAKPGGPVSIPVKWSELGNIYPTDYTILTAYERIEQHGDLWGDILLRKQNLQRTLGLDA